MAQASVINTKLNLIARLNDDAIEPLQKVSSARKYLIVRVRIAILWMFLINQLFHFIPSVGNGHQTQPLSLKFFPSIYLHTPELILSTDTQAGSIIITGLRHVLEKTTVS